jgi:hypothetical protein
VSLDAVSRRLELLKLEGLGFSKAETVKEPSQKLARAESKRSWLRQNTQNDHRTGTNTRLGIEEGNA